MTERTPTGVALRRQARARAQVEAEVLLRVMRHDEDGLMLASLSRAATGLADALAAHVAAMREDGASWAAIGEGMGVTRQAAFQRFGSGRPPVVGAEDVLVRRLLERDRYADRLPARKVRAGAVGDVANDCFTRHHGRCKGWGLGQPCACWCHEPGVLFAPPVVGL